MRAGGRMLVLTSLALTQWGCGGCGSPAEQVLDDQPAPVASGASGGDEVLGNGRVYASADGGRTWHVSDEGLPANATVNAFAIAGGVVFVGTSSHGVYASRNGGAIWERIMESPGADSAVNAMVATSSVIMAGMRARGVVASRDGGASWKPANQGLTNLEIRRLVAIGDRFFAATNAGLFASDDDGDSWNHLVGDGQINGVAGLHGALYAADVEGVLTSRDGGSRWQRTYEGGTPHNLGSDGSSLFAMLYWRGLLRTTDGQSWEAAQNGLPDDLSQYTFQIVPADGKLYAAQWHGLYISDSGGTNWRPSSEGLPPNLAITDILRISPDALLAAAVVSSAR